MALFSRTILTIACFLLATPGVAASAEEEKSESNHSEESLLSGIRQLTFAGKRSGEGYFSPDGTKLIFQSERDPENPFYQIFLLDLETGDIDRVSPGHGKTTCGWFFPNQDRVLFASTHEDPEAVSKQKAELEFRASGQSRRYAWDYDEHFDIFVSDLDGNGLINLTRTLGYDAEGSASPDGKQIVFSSNRLAYSEPLSDHDAELLKTDQSYFLDLYVMQADGSTVRRLTDAKGYDGGPFFSPDGERITWRRFSEDGATAEVFTIRPDGSDERQLTKLGAMSWAPFFHPSGDYLIFTTNLHGFGNFELYLVDSLGKSRPLRVTFTDGFDGLPVFSPDGRDLVWTSSRTADKSSQMFLAKWNDGEARRLLGLDPESLPLTVDGSNDFSNTAPEISADDLKKYVSYLASDKLEGRLTGSPGEDLATRYVADAFEMLGLEPAAADGSFFEEFEFTAGVSLGGDNRLSAELPQSREKSWQVDADWRPLAFSASGSFGPSEVAFAGYGIVAPAKEGFPEYDSYVHLDVTDKWVLVLRYLPENITPEHRQHLARHASLRYKAMVARDRGARGILVVSGPRSKVKEPLVELSFDASLAGTSVAALSVVDSLAESLLESAGKDLGSLQDQLDGGELQQGFALEGVKVAADIEIIQQKGVGKNVIARLSSGVEGASAIAVGAHLDHLGRGLGGTSLAGGDEKGQIHYGADDNASGTASILEIAQYLVDQKKRGRLKLKRDILFTAWSGEELGIIGSSYFAEARSGSDHPHQAPSLQGQIDAYLNLDMVGRLRDAVVLQGVGSSSIWPEEIERRNVPVGLPIVTQDDSYLPTDATAFYVKGVPVLSAFTGSHEDYHRPGDTAEKINYDGTAKIARFMALMARALAEREEAPDYIAQTKPESQQGRAGLRAYLGTVPDYVQGDQKGLRISGVAEGGPADEAGLRAGDVIVELAGRTIENIYDYTYAIDALKVGETVKVVVMREGKRLELEITPSSRE